MLHNEMDMAKVRVEFLPAIMDRADVTTMRGGPMAVVKLW
jgi:hypothetical protein